MRRQKIVRQKYGQLDIFTTVLDNDGNTAENHFGMLLSMARPLGLEVKKIDNFALDT